MSIRFSLAHLTVLSYSPPELIRVAAKSGYDFASLRTIYMGLPNEPNYDLAANPGLLAETKRALAETGLRVHDVELAKINDDTDPRSYLPALETAAELGCGRVISSVWTPRREFAVDRFRELCELALPLGLEVDLEFMIFSELKSLAESVAFLRDAGAGNARLLIDTLHVHCARVPLSQLDDIPRDLLGFIHLCDGPAKVPETRDGLVYLARSTRRYPGQGGIDIAGVVNRLPELVCSIELPNPIMTEIIGREGHVRRCLETAKAYFAAHPRLADGAP